VPAGAGGGRARAHSAGAAGRGAALAAAAVAHAALAACDGRWLTGFHDAGEEARREAGRAFIPASSEGVAGLWRVNGDFLQAVQAQRPAAQATLDTDATLVETHKRAALYCYKRSLGEKTGVGRQLAGGGSGWKCARKKTSGAGASLA